MDTAHIESIPEGAYLLWFETRHATLQTEGGKPWNREIIRSFLRCQPLSFKTVRATLPYNEGPVVAEQGEDVAVAMAAPWKAVASPSVDEGAMGGACALLRSRVQIQR